VLRQPVPGDVAGERGHGRQGDGGSCGRVVWRIERDFGTSTPNSIYYSPADIHFVCRSHFVDPVMGKLGPGPWTGHSQT
jgi:hypothetical protein